MLDTNTFHQRVLRIVQAIPAGSVTTYGELAHAAGRPNGARQIGSVLYRLRREDPNLFVPWYRVVNASGRISIADVKRQQDLLEDEGVAFSAPGVIADFASIRFPLELISGETT